MSNSPSSLLLLSLLLVSASLSVVDDDRYGESRAYKIDTKFSTCHAFLCPRSLLSSDTPSTSTAAAMVESELTLCRVVTVSIRFAVIIVVRTVGVVVIHFPCCFHNVSNSDCVIFCLSFLYSTATFFDTFHGCGYRYLIRVDRKYFLVRTGRPTVDYRRRAPSSKMGGDFGTLNWNWNWIQNGREPLRCWVLDGTNRPTFVPSFPFSSFSK